MTSSSILTFGIRQTKGAHSATPFIEANDRQIGIVQDTCDFPSEAPAITSISGWTSTSQSIARLWLSPVFRRRAWPRSRLFRTRAAVGDVRDGHALERTARVTMRQHPASAICP